ncbi:MAG: glycerol-3-phosphate dehydrogenase C-terminal domain-containing protein, partial [Gemmatimonadota bacterium]
DHTLHIAGSGLVTIAGGKWTTYRKMAEDTIDQTALIADLEDRDCVTKTLQIHGYHKHAEEFGPLAVYGSDAPDIQTLMRDEPALAERLHPDHDVVAAQVVWAARYEGARAVEDVLARRTRMLLFDARASIEMAPTVAALLADELGRDAAWQKEQVEGYETLARGYLAPSGISSSSDG